MTKELKAQDFVFTGWREHKGRLYLAVTPIQDGELLNTGHYSTKGKRRWVVGGVYTGAMFSSDTAKGLEQARYDRMWDDKGAIIHWQAVSDEAEATVRSVKVETDARKRNEIEAAMLPLRKQYAVLLKQRDRAGLAALENAVVRALRAPVRAAEDN